MPKRPVAVTASLALVLLAAVACGASKSTSPPTGTGSQSASTTGSSAPVSKKTVKVGLLVDATGLESEANKGTIIGAKAAATVLAQQGITVNFVVGDAATNPATVLTAAQKLVASDKVDAIVANSAVTFGAAPYLAQQHIPVIGLPQDGPEWLTLKNMFSTVGPLDTTKVASTTGQYFKLEGGTVSGSLGFAISPTSAEAAKATGVSAAAAGLKNGYVNSNFQFGSTNVQPIALAMKNAGVDSIQTLTDQTSGLALLTALHQAGVTLKVGLLSVGYGADTLDAGSAAIQAAQGASVGLSFAPVELQTPATKTFVSALQAVGANPEPSYSEYNGYVSMLLLAQALASSSGTTPSAILTALTGVTSFDAGGLLGANPVDPNKRSISPGDKQCSYFVKLSGTTFVPVQGASPLCGTYLSATVSASS